MRRLFLIIGAGAILLTLNILAQQLTFEMIERDKRTKTDEFLLDLKNDKYTSSTYNPVLKSSDIPKLLELASNNAILTHFPTNPISSFALAHVRLSTVSLWLIEGIRVNKGDFDVTQIGKLPSQNVFLMDNTSKIDTSRQEQFTKKAAQLYSEWYKTSQTPILPDWNKNPLSGSGLWWK